MDIKDVLAPSQLVIHRHPADKAQLLDHLSRRAAAALNLPYDEILRALTKREALGSTGLGGGVALPHAQVPGVMKPFAMLVCLREAIDFDAIDGEPVDVVCVLLMPIDAKDGQAAPACVVRALRNANVLQKLRRATDVREAYSALDG